MDLTSVRHLTSTDSHFPRRPLDTARGSWDSSALLILRCKCQKRTNSPAGRTESHFAPLSQFASRPVSGLSQEHPMSFGSVFCLFRRQSKGAIERSGTVVAHLLCKYSPAKRTDTARNDRFALRRTSEANSASGARIRRETWHAIAITDAALHVRSRRYV